MYGKQKIVLSDAAKSQNGLAAKDKHLAGAYPRAQPQLWKMVRDFLILPEENPNWRWQFRSETGSGTPFGLFKGTEMRILSCRLPQTGGKPMVELSPILIYKKLEICSP
tara:strand:- start:2067 stop:2393 length:327 start_codon:yes stop_codon:yes gene_type:complete